MATKQITLSDISGTELGDDDHVTAIVDHPDHPAKRLDISTDEAAKLSESSLRFVTFTLHEPNQRPRTVRMETKIVDKMFGINIDELVSTAPKAEVASRPAVRAKASTTAASYLPGQLHKGRISPAEAESVRSDPDQASRNREAQTGSPIDWTDAKEKKRYGL